MDLFDYATKNLTPKASKEAPTNTPQKPPLLTVSQLSNTLKTVVEDLFGDVEVEGEVSQLKQAVSGHVYFSLKDSNAVLSAIIWAPTVRKLQTLPKEGDKIIISGRLTTYPARSSYQLIVSAFKPAGQGDLLQQLEALKQKLRVEGIFDAQHKRPLPFLPQKIGIITSPTGAVIDDMLHRIAERCPRPVMLCGVAVQGTKAPAEIISALHTFNALPLAQRPDVLLIARGGGSLEDLMAFNDEGVVRAIANSDIITISGVGHEPDTTLADFAADKRAPTPTAAAEMVTPMRHELLAMLENAQKRLPQTFLKHIHHTQNRLALMAKTLQDPRKYTTQLRLTLEDKAERLHTAITAYVAKHQQHLLAQAQNLGHLAPDAPLKRGYLYATTASGKIIRTAKTPEKTATLHFHDGTREAILSQTPTNPRKCP